MFGDGGKSGGGLIGGIIDPVLEGLFGGNTDYEDRKAREAAQKALAEFQGLEAPDLTSIDFDEYQWLGDLAAPPTITAPQIDAGADVVYEGVDPVLAELALAGPSAMNDISVDPRLADHQMASIDALDEIIAGGGLSASDRAALNQVQSDVAAADRGRRGAIQQNMAARGMGGSGMELLALLDSSQAATDRANQSGLDIAGMSQDRLLDSIVQRGLMAGDVRGQEFGEQSAVAEANDLIDRFNAQNTNQWSQYNTGTINDMAMTDAARRLDTDMYNTDRLLRVREGNADRTMRADELNTSYAHDTNLYNQQGRQQVADANTGVRNDQLMHNRFTVPQQQFSNAFDVASGKSNAYGAQQDYWAGQAAREKAEAAARQNLVVQGVTTAVTAGQGSPATTTKVAKRKQDPTKFQKG